MMRYSLNSVFVLLTVLSVTFSVVFTMPATVTHTITAVVAVLIVPTLACGGIYCAGYVRAFCVGAALPLGAFWALVLLENRVATRFLLNLLDVYAMYPHRAQLAIFSFFSMVVASGVTAMAMRWLGERQRSQARRHQMKRLAPVGAPSVRTA